MKGALSKILQRNEVEELSIDELLNTMNQRKETDVYENADALVMPVELRDAEDVTKILEEAQEGNIVILNIKDVQARNP
ncbi:MAG: cell division protein SepF, partial [Candidatus Diapherotrites archaeon]|nr:cell division protein SepF [Candidatus Diapherotrites archaeon]